MVPHQEEQNELAEKHTPEIEMIEGKRFSDTQTSSDGK